MEERNQKSSIEELCKKAEAIVLEDGRIVEVEFLEACTPEPYRGLKVCKVPDCLKVKVELTPSDVSLIRMEVWLPLKKWNGRYLGMGNGGKAGQIVEVSLQNGVSRGYATANTDMGTAPDTGSLYNQPERWKDFGHRATHLMTVTAKKIIKEFYGQDPEHSFFMGGSTGGQQALMEAQRYPEDYDGIIALSPAWNRVRLHTRFIKNWQICRRMKERFNQEFADTVTEYVVEKYGEQSGSDKTDRFLKWPSRVNLDLSVFDELIEKQKMSLEQKEALEELYRDFKDPVTGALIFPGMPPGTEASDLGLAALGNTEQFAEDFFFPYQWLLGEDFDFEKIDFHRDTELALKELSPYLDASSTDLSAFHERGGKLILAAGTSDPIISYKDTENYYEKVKETMGEKLDDFFVYYLVPGMGHFSGPGVQDIGSLGLPQIPRDREHDIIVNLEEWVIYGRKPEMMRAARLENASLLGAVVGEMEVPLRE